MYARRYFYSLMCLDTWDTDNTGTICVKRKIGISDEKELLIPIILQIFNKEDKNETY